GRTRENGPTNRAVGRAGAPARRGGPGRQITSVHWANWLAGGSLQPKRATLLTFGACPAGYRIPGTSCRCGGVSRVVHSIDQIPAGVRPTSPVTPPGRLRSATYG